MGRSDFYSMKTKIRKGLSILLIAAFCFGILISPGGVAEAADSVSVTDFQGLLDELGKGATVINLNGDIDITETVYINGAVTINGGNHKLNVAEDVYLPMQLNSNAEAEINTLFFYAPINNVQTFVYSNNAKSVKLTNTKFEFGEPTNEFEAVFVQNGGKSILKENSFEGLGQKGIGIQINSGEANLNKNNINNFKYGLQVKEGSTINGVKVPAETPSFTDYNSIMADNTFEDNTNVMVGIDNEGYLCWDAYNPRRDEARLSEIIVDGEKLDGFSSDKDSYNYILPFGTTGLPEVEAETVDSNAKLQINTDENTGRVTITVAAEDGVTKKTYTIIFCQQIKIPASASPLNNSIKMLAPDNTEVDPGDSTWTIDVGEVDIKQNISKADLEYKLPDGLEIANVENGLVGNSINITVAGEVYKSNITQPVDVEVVVKSSAAEDPWYIDSDQVVFKIYPGGVIQVRAQAEDDTIKMKAPDFTKVDPADDSWKIKVTQGKLKEEVYNDNLSLLGLPENLDYTVKVVPENSLLISVSGSVYGASAVPIDDIHLVVKGSAVREAGAIDSLPVTLRIDVGGPKCIAHEPSGSGWFDEKDLFPQPIKELGDKERYFLRLTFENIGGGLSLTDDALNALRRSTVSSQGGSQQSMMDLDFLQYIEGLDEDARKAFINTYLFKKDGGNACLFIPINPLRPQTTYDVYISSGIVKYPKGRSNDPVQWSFSTTAYPQVSGISLGSVGEDYDADDPILVTGDHFYTGGSIQVLFNDTPARRVEVVNEKGKCYLKVYLPSGSNRLKAGVYNVTVINKGEGKYKETLYGQFSVIAAAKGTVPEDGKHIKDRPREGDVIASVNSSEDTLELNSHYTNRSYLELDLDELMGETSWQRKIVYDAYRGDRIGELKLISNCATVSLFGLGPNTSYRNDKIEIRTGRAAPIQAKSLITKLGRMQTCSDVIELTGKNFGVERVAVAIPYRNAGDKPLKVMRYDEYGRCWHEVAAGIDRVNQIAIAANTRPGYFVVVE